MVRAESIATASRWTFSLMTSFSSPNWISSASFASSAFAFSRRLTTWRSESGIAWPPCGFGTWISVRSSAYSSKKTGLSRSQRATSSAFRTLNLDLSLEHGLSRPGHVHRIVRAAPSDRQFPAAGGDGHRRVEEAEPDAGDDRRARAGPAGERLARAALVDAERDAMPVDHEHVAGVHPLRKARVTLDQRPLSRDRREVDVGLHLARMRIAHRDHDDVCGAAVNVQRPDVERAGAGRKRRGRRQVAQGREAGRIERHASRLERRRAHVDRHPAVVLEARRNHARERFDADLALVGETLVAHEPDEASGAVAALLDLAAVGVEDPVTEVHSGRARPLDDQDLVAADAEVAVGEAPQRRLVELDPLRDAVEHHEVVADAVHLREPELHFVASPRMRWQMTSASSSARRASWPVAAGRSRPRTASTKAASSASSESPSGYSSRPRAMPGMSPPVAAGSARANSTVRS